MTGTGSGNASDQRNMTARGQAVQRRLQLDGAFACFKGELLRSERKLSGGMGEGGGGGRWGLGVWGGGVGRVGSPGGYLPQALVPTVKRTPKAVVVTSRDLVER